MGRRTGSGKGERGGISFLVTAICSELYKRLEVQQVAVPIE